MKKNNFFKFIGFVGALFIVIFGNVSNFLRTIGMMGKKENKKDNK